MTQELNLVLNTIAQFFTKIYTPLVTFWKSHTLLFSMFCVFCVVRFLLKPLVGGSFDFGFGSGSSDEAKAVSGMEKNGKKG